MSIEETKQVVEAFVETSEGCWLAEAVQLCSPTRVIASGRDAVREALAGLHSSEIVADRTTETRVVVADGIAAVEIRPWPRDPDDRPDDRTDGHRKARSAACFYEVSGGEIVRASVHIDSPASATTGGDQNDHRAHRAKD